MGMGAYGDLVAGISSSADHSGVPELTRGGSSYKSNAHIMNSAQQIWRKAARKKFDRQRILKEAQAVKLLKVNDAIYDVGIVLR